MATIINKVKENQKLEELKELLGKGRSKKGMFEGDLVNGELEIGQVSSLIDSIPTVAEVFDDLLVDYQVAKDKLIRL